MIMINDNDHDHDRDRDHDHDHDHDHGLDIRPQPLLTRVVAKHNFSFPLLPHWHVRHL